MNVCYRVQQDLVNPWNHLQLQVAKSRHRGTRHGQPAFLCYIDLHVTIQSQDILYSVNIPSKSLILVMSILLMMMN
jgi:hypothetical protein